MDKDYIKKMIQEAKHSIKILMCFVGKEEASPVMMKWPDILDAYIDDDFDKLKTDLSAIMCAPLRVITQSLIELSLSYPVPKELIAGWQIQLEWAVDSIIVDPFEAKKYFIANIDAIILYLRKHNVNYNPIGSIK